MLDSNSADGLVITIDFRRIFMGEDTPISKLRSDTIASSKLGYDIKITRDTKALRQLRKINLNYSAGFVRNMKFIMMMEHIVDRQRILVSQILSCF